MRGRTNRLLADAEVGGQLAQALSHGEGPGRASRLVGAPRKAASGPVQAPHGRPVGAHRASLTAPRAAREPATSGSPTDRRSRPWWRRASRIKLAGLMLLATHRLGRRDPFANGPYLCASALLTLLG